MRQTGNFGQSYPSEVNTIIRVLVLLQKFHHQYYNMRFQTVIVRLVELSLNSSAFIWISERSEKFGKLLTDQRWDTRVRPRLMKRKIIFLHYIIQGHNVLNINEDILKIDVSTPWSVLSQAVCLCIVTPGADKSSINSGDSRAWPEPESGTFNIGWKQVSLLHSNQYPLCVMRTQAF